MAVLLYCYFFLLIFPPGYLGFITVFQNAMVFNVSHESKDYIQIQEVFLEDNNTELDLQIRWVYLPLEQPYATFKIVSGEMNINSFKNGHIFLVIGSAYNSPVLRNIAYQNRVAIHGYWPTSLDPVDIAAVRQFCIETLSLLDFDQRNTVREYKIFSPGMFEETKVIRSVVREIGWTNMVIIYDETTKERVKDLSDALLNIDCKLLMYNIDREQNIDKILSTSYEDVNYGQRQFLVLCSTYNVDLVVNYANNFDRKNENTTAINLITKWLIVRPEYETISLDYRQIQLDNFAIVHIQTPHAEEWMDTPALKQKMEADVVKSFTSMVRNNFTLDENRLTSGLKRVFLGAKESYERCYRAKIQTLFFKTDGRQLGTVSYMKSDYTFTTHDDIFPNSKFGFNKRTFKVATNEWPPFVKKHEENGVITFEGLCIDLLWELSRSLNFSFEIVEPSDGEWGMDKNGTWTGMIGQVLNREVDFVMAPIGITSQRIEVADFTFPFFHDYSAIIFKMPDADKYKWKKLTNPFKWPVYVCIIFSFIALTVLYFTTENANPFYLTQRMKKRRYLDVALYFYGAMLSQGGYNQPRSSSGRFLIAFWWFFSIVVAATYCGNLIAFLTVAKDKPPFETLDELANQDEYKCGVMDGTNWYNFFKSTKNDDVSKLWRRMVEFNKSDPTVFDVSSTKQFQKVKSEPYAFVGDRASFQMHVAQDCRLAILKEPFYPQKYGVVLPKHSPYYNIFDDEIARIYEMGLMQILRKRWWPSETICIGSSMSYVRTIELLDIQSAFYVIAFGTITSSFVILIEFVIKKCTSIANIMENDAIQNGIGK